ncbi:MAG: ABC transporter ATP-binding protein [Actinomycetota bacterium]|nr:ABC transporter ATP-binding protein [Actinomycetota bacterium]
MSAIELVQVTKGFGATPVLAGVDLEVPAGSVTAVLGASGSGKTTLLRLLAGFDQVDSGTIAIGGSLVDDGRRMVRSQHRGVGYVPQDGALFPHLTVKGNVGFGLSRGERSGVAELLRLVGLGDLERRYPHQLSGGQQQRVALARALAIRPRVVLLDEPFSSLDAALRSELRRDVARILGETGTTTVLVTHDQDEALGLADQIAVLGEGRVLACADPRELYRDPPDVAAAASIGEANILPAHTRADVASCALGSVSLPADGGRLSDGPCRLMLRPEQLVLHASQRDGAARASIVEVQYHGHDALAHVRLSQNGHETLLARVPGELALARGQEVWVEVVGLARAWPAP